MDGRWTPSSLQLTLASGLPTSVPLELAVAQFLVRCDGEKTLAELVAELAAAVQAPPDQVSAQCCAVVRKLAERRFLILQ